MNSQSVVKDNKTRPLYQTLERLIPVKKSFVSSNVRHLKKKKKKTGIVTFGQGCNIRLVSSLILYDCQSL